MTFNNNGSFNNTLAFSNTAHGTFSAYFCNPLFHMGKETNSSLDTFTEQTIFDFLLTYFLQTAPQNLLCCEIFNISLKD